MTARNLALEALKDLVAHFGEQHSGEFSEIECVLCDSIAKGRAAIAALEAETGEVAAWIGHSQVTGLKFAAMPDEHRSEACAPCIPTYTAPPPAVPPGWKLVPIEPTPEMWKAGLAHLFRDVDAVWRAMLAEVPEAPK